MSADASGDTTSSEGAPGRSQRYWNGRAGMWDPWPRQTLHGVIYNGMLGDADAAKAVVLVPVLGLVVVPVGGAQVLGRIVEGAAAQDPPPSSLRLPVFYFAMCDNG
jgi:hypothetical protein